MGDELIHLICDDKFYRAVFQPLSFVDGHGVCYLCFLQVQIPEMGVRTFFWTVSTPVTSVIVKQTFFLKIAVACKYLISKDWLCLAIEL